MRPSDWLALTVTVFTGGTAKRLELSGQHSWFGRSVFRSWLCGRSIDGHPDAGEPPLALSSRAAEAARWPTETNLETLRRRELAMGKLPAAVGIVIVVAFALNNLVRISQIGWTESKGILVNLVDERGLATGVAWFAVATVITWGTLLVLARFGGGAV